MISIFKKKEENTPIERLKKVESRLLALESEILDIATAQNIIRNKVLKKIQFKNPKQEEEEEEQNPYDKVLLKEK